MVVYCCSNTSGDHIRVVRGATESNPHGTYDHHMLVIAVIDDVTLHVIHYTHEVADAAADSAVTSFGSFGRLGGGEDVDCEGRGDTRGGSAGAVKEQKVRIQVRTEKLKYWNTQSSVALTYSHLMKPLSVPGADWEKRSTDYSKITVSVL